MKPEQPSEIVRRLRCAAGHLNAVIEMTETGQPCEQVLHQLNAVEAALRVAISIWSAAIVAALVFFPLAWVSVIGPRKSALMR